MLLLDKVFKSGLCKFFKGCLPQDLLSPLSNTLSQSVMVFLIHCSGIFMVDFEIDILDWCFIIYQLQQECKCDMINTDYPEHPYFPYFPYFSFVGDKAKMQISKRREQENKARQIYGKNEHLFPWYAHVHLTFVLRFALLPYHWRIVSCSKCFLRSVSNWSNQQ